MSRPEGGVRRQAGLASFAILEGPSPYGIEARRILHGTTSIEVVTEHVDRVSSVARRSIAEDVQEAPPPMTRRPCLARTAARRGNLPFARGAVGR